MDNIPKNNSGYTLSKDAVHLDLDSLDVARSCNLSPVEYARLVLRLREMKRAGSVQER